MYSSLSQLQNSVFTGKTTCRQIVEQYLQQIEKTREFNIFLEVFATSALQKADEVDKKIQEGKQGKLAGLVIAIKDNICYKGHRVSAASKILEGFVSLYSATAIERLLQEDAIIIGRTNCDEFAMGSSNENSAFGEVKHPLAPDRVPGGSSGGSAAAVAAHLALAALGSDTGGSIRQPASFCGVVGLKPTYGVVSRWGLIAYASSFDQIGPLTKTVEDSRRILEVIAVPDEFDSTCIGLEKGEKIISSTHPSFPTKEVSIGYLVECIEHPALHIEIKERLLEIIEQLKQRGHRVEPVKFPYLEYLVPCYYVLTTAEASSNLARYDGVRYGFRSPEATDLEGLYKKTRSQGFGKEVKRRIMLGTFVLSSGYYEAYYAKAQKVRRMIRDATLHILNQYNFIVLPTTPDAAFRYREIQDPIQMYLQDIFTVLANLTGLPAISLPVGKKKNGLPFGVQLIGKPFSDKKLIDFSSYLAQQLSLSC